MLLSLILLAGSALASGSPADGVIEGVVVRAVDRTPVAGAEVVLRARVDGQTLSVAATASDAKGRFCFEHLPADRAYDYLPGANHDGIHYPGPSVRLTALRRRADTTLAVHDAVAFPNPLVVRRHEITLQPELGVLRVTESISIDNPSTACYVGQAAGEGVEPVTLQLAIPADFEKVTFDNEFFGRRFALSGGKLTTAVPWPPGPRELSFTYLLGNPQRHYVWRRPLDLPTDKLRVVVRGDQSGQATCNLDRVVRQEYGAVAFDSDERKLSAGYTLSVELGNLPVSAITYGRWGALAMLAGLILATALPLMRRGRRVSSDRHTGSS